MTPGLWHVKSGTTRPVGSPLAYNGAWPGPVARSRLVGGRGSRLGHLAARRPAPDSTTRRPARPGGAPRVPLATPAPNQPQEALQCPTSDTPCPRPATSGSWPTSTRARPRRPSGSSTTRGATTRSARSMTARPPWTGWPRSRSGASPSPRPRPTASGGTTASTSSTRPAMSTSPSRWSDRCGCSTARWPCSTVWPGWSPRPRRCGGRPTATACPGCASSTRWTAPAPTSTSCSTPSGSG